MTRNDLLLWWLYGQIKIIDKNQEPWNSISTLLWLFNLSILKNDSNDTELIIGIQFDIFWSPYDGQGKKIILHIQE